MESIALWFAGTLGKYISSKLAVFIVSLVPILECRGGLIASALLKVDIRYAVPLCILGNILPIPFILLFIKRIFKWLKKFNFSRPLIEKLENRAMNKSKNMSNGEFLGLLLFVGIPLPGTGAWTGSLIANFLHLPLRKACLPLVAGVFTAGIIMLIGTAIVRGGIQVLFN